MKNYEEFKTRVEELAIPYNITDDTIEAITIHGYRAFNSFDGEYLIKSIGKPFAHILEQIKQLNMLLKVCPYTFKAYYEIMDAAIEEGVDDEC